MVNYNGYNFPDIETVWTDKITYPYAYITYIGSSWTNNPHYALELSAVPVAYNTSTCELTASRNTKFYTQSYGIYDENYSIATEWTKFRGWYVTTRTIADLNNSCVLIWASEDIYDTDGNLYFLANPTVTETPTITQDLPLFGEVTYTQDDYAEALTVVAEVSDGGILTYQWYKDDIAIDGATESTYVPLTDEVGSSTYYCQVTNTKYGDSKIINSNFVVIVVRLNLKDWLTGWLYGMVGRLMIVKAKPIEPDTPVTTSLYLYGTPSETGNVGLQNGDAVTYYDGVVANSIPTEHEKNTAGREYSYAIIYRKDENEYNVLFTTSPAVKITDGGNVGFLIDTNYYLYTYKLNENKEWEDSVGFWGPMSSSGGYLFWETSGRVFVWANYDIVDAETGKMYFSKSGPIPVSGLVGNNYSGTVLPVLPEWDKETYPYAFISEYVNATGIRTISLLISHIELQRTSTDKYNEYIYHTGNCMSTILLSTGKWNTFKETSSIGTIITNGDGTPVSRLVWTNYDMQNADGTIYYTKSDPIPIYK